MTRMDSLYCPFTSSVHEDASSVHAGSVLWARSLGMLPTEQHVKHANKAKVGWLVARAFPTATSCGLQLVADWTMLFCLLDDHIEKRGTAVDVEDYLQHLLDLFRADIARSSDDPFAAGLLDIRARLLALGPISYFMSFADRLEVLFAGFATEAKNRDSAVIPDLASYLPLREVTVGLQVMYALAELLEGFSLPAAAHEHPAIQALAKHTSNIVGWANDLFTYEKEFREGEIHNLVLVLMNERGISLTQAVGQATELHDNEIHSFLACVEQLPSFGAADRDVACYVEMLRCWIRGHLDWAHETGRYRPFEDRVSEQLTAQTGAQTDAQAAA
jgi:hypothetical protein